MVRSTPSTPTRPILDIIADCAPRPIKRNPSPRWRYQMVCPFPDHDDGVTDGGSFYVDQSQELYRCFGCDARGNAYQLQRLLEGQADRPSVAARPKKGRAGSNRLPRSAPPFQGVSIEQLARAKSLDADYLKFLGWADTTYGITPAIQIPYFDQKGNDPLIRYRVGLDQGERFRWRRFSKGQCLRPYGLWNLPWIQDQGYCFLVEGETDYAALSYRRVAVLGIPGANNYRSEWTPWLEGLHLCAWQEPGKGGDKFIQRMRSEFDSLEVIDAPDHAKDPCALLGGSWL
jgi:hypothetical protein